MKVMTNGPGNGQLPKAILVFFYLYFLLHWATGVVMFTRKLGFNISGIKLYYLGNPDLFLNPRSFDGLLEVTHFHLFAMGFYFVVFTHLLQYTGLKPNFQKGIVWGLALSLLADIASGWLIRYVDATFAYLKLGAFLLGQGLCLILIASLLTAQFRQNGMEQKHPGQQEQASTEQESR